MPFTETISISGKTKWDFAYLALLICFSILSFQGCTEGTVFVLWDEFNLMCGSYTTSRWVSKRGPLLHLSFLLIAWLAIPRSACGYVSISHPQGLIQSTNVGITHCNVHTVINQGFPILFCFLPCFIVTNEHQPYADSNPLLHLVLGLVLQHKIHWTAALSFFIVESALPECIVEATHTTLVSFHKTYRTFPF